MTSPAVLGLGTAQFGGPYGVSNVRGKPTEAEVRHILAVAGQRGVQVLDTAPAYGDSEEVLGRALAPGHSFRIVTKTPTAADSAGAGGVAQAVSDSLQRTLRHLRQPAVDGLIVHNARQVLEESGGSLIEAMLEQKARGRVRAIGVSVYEAEQVDRVLDVFTPDLVQLPLNALDQRLLRSGHIRALAAAGIEIHVRSVFLQGLLLMAPEQMPPHLATAAPFVSAFRHAAAQQGVSLVAAALGFVRGVPGVGTILAGVTALAELEQVLGAWNDSPAGLDLELSLPPPPDTVVDPRLWRTA